MCQVVHSLFHRLKLLLSLLFAQYFRVSLIIGLQSLKIKPFIPPLQGGALSFYLAAFLLMLVHMRSWHWRRKYYDLDFHRRSIRLRGYDYSKPGAYFVTLCANGRECLFSADSAKDIIQRTWNDLPIRFSNVALDEFVIMPNHVHGIIVLNPVGAGSTRPGIGGAWTAPLQGTTLGQIIAYFKYHTTKAINRGWSLGVNSVWQRNYYEHIIRNKYELKTIRRYVLNNPLNWDEDEDNPKNWHLG